MKKFYVSLLLFLLGASNLFAAERDEIIDGITYTLNSVTNNAIVISTPGGSVSIPATVQYNSRTYTVISVQNVGDVTSVDIAEGIESIGTAFNRHRNLTSVSIPSTVSRIEDGAFWDCTALTSVVLSDGLSYIGKEAFKGCSELFEITIPTTLTSMGDNAFGGCNKLGKITWNAKHCADFTSRESAPFVTILDANIAHRTYNSYTTSIEFGEEVEYIPAYLCCAFMNISTVTIPNSVKEIGPWAFYGMHNQSYSSGATETIIDSKLQSIKFGTGLEKISEYAFVARTGLTSISIPDNCTEIGGAFGSCFNLQTVTLGKNIRIIGGGAFYCDNNLKTINIYALTPPVITDNVFEGYSDGLQAITLNVRPSAIEAYMAADVWKEMFVEAMESDIRTYTLSVSSEDEKKGLAFQSGVYDEDTEVVIYVATMPGYQFSKWSDGNTDNPRTVKMVGDITLIAQFEAATPVVKYNLSATANPLEGVAVGGGTFESGAQVTLAAVANDGYHFTQWADGNTSNPRQVTVAADGVYTAQFEKDAVIQRYTLTTSTTNAAQGTAYGQGTYEAGTQIAVFAVANDGYHFTQWHDGNTENPRMVTVAADAMYFANFAQDPVAPTLYELNVSSESPAKGWTTEGCAYELGAQVMIYAHPAAGFEFSQWSDGNTDNPRFITMTGEVNLTAQFVVKTTTNVSSANVSAAPAHKILRNGQVLIERSGKIYTLQGQEVK